MLQFFAISQLFGFCFPLFSNKKKRVPLLSFAIVVYFQNFGFELMCVNRAIGWPESEHSHAHLKCWSNIFDMHSRPGLTKQTDRVCNNSFLSGRNGKMRKKAQMKVTRKTVAGEQRQTVFSFTGPATSQLKCTNAHTNQHTTDTYLWESRSFIRWLGKTTNWILNGTWEMCDLPVLKFSA